MKNVVKVLKILLVLIIVVLMLSNPIYADDLTTGMDPNQWGMSGDSGIIGKVLGMVLGVLQVVGVIVTVLSIVIAGMKYMVSSTNDKATIKQQALPLVIGGIIIFGASSILKLISKFVSEAL